MVQSSRIVGSKKTWYTEVSPKNPGERLFKVIVKEQ